MVLRMRKIAPALAVLIAAGVLALALQGPMAALLTEPLVRLWWFIDSLPQRLMWGALALLGLLVTFLLGRGPRRERPGSELESPPRRSPSQTQIDHLARLIRLAETSPWAREALGRYLRERAAGLRALREGIDLEEAREEIHQGRWPTDPRLAEVLRPEREGRDRHYDYDYDYAAKLVYVLDFLECYAKGEDFGLECEFGPD